MPTSRQAVQSCNWTIVQPQAQELVVEVSQLALAKPAEPAEPAVPASAHWVALLTVQMTCPFLAASYGAAETAPHQAAAVVALQAAAVEALQAE